MSDATEGYDPDIDNAAAVPLEAGDDTAGLRLDLVDDTSARARSQRRLTQARSAMSDAATRARNTAALPTRRPAVAGDDLGIDEPSTFSALSDHIAAYRTYIAAAALAVLGLLALARKRRATTVEDTVDLGDWHLHAEPAGQ